MAVRMFVRQGLDETTFLSALRPSVHLSIRGGRFLEALPHRSYLDFAALYTYTTLTAAAATRKTKIMASLKVWGLGFGGVDKSLGGKLYMLTLYQKGLFICFGAPLLTFLYFGRRRNTIH